MRVVQVFLFAYIDEIIDSILRLVRANLLEPGPNVLLWLQALINQANSLKSGPEDPGRMSVNPGLRVDKAYPICNGKIVANRSMSRPLAILATWHSRVGSGGSSEASPLTGQIYVAEINRVH
jgi:hypothetical protein